MQAQAADMIEAVDDVTARSVPAEPGEAVWFTVNRMTIKATAESTGGAFGLVEAIGPAASSSPLHVHHREDESFYLLEGRLTVRCGDRTFTAEPGSFTFLPRGVPHSFVVEATSRRACSRCASRAASSATSPMPAAPPKATASRRRSRSTPGSCAALARTTASRSSGPPLQPTRG
jgi:mannose-6-phosphate isomerase-like protein (cupin superfamily)